MTTTRTLRLSLLIFLLAGTVTLMGCAGDVEEGVEDAEVDTAFVEGDDAMSDTEMATAQLVNQQGNDAGTLRFTSDAGGLAGDDGGVNIQGTARGLAPGEHGFHIHQNGECDPNAADGPFTTAGSHWDPMNTNNHAGPDTPVEERHMGDLGNISAGSDSTAQIDETFDFLTLSGDTSIVGHAIMIHSGEDDLETDPSGNSGDRVVCGVIEMGGSMNRDTTTTM